MNDGRDLAKDSGEVISDCLYKALYSVENPPKIRNLVCWCDGDIVAEPAKGSLQHLNTFLPFFSGTHFVALLDDRTPSCKIFQTTRQSRHSDASSIKRDTSSSEGDCFVFSMKKGSLSATTKSRI